MVFLQPGVECGEAHAQRPRGSPLVPPMGLQSLHEDLLLGPLEPRLVGGAFTARSTRFSSSCTLPGQS